MIGHDVPKRLFAAALASGRLAHAYLLAGPEGVGKSTFAAEMAKSILCVEESRPCGRCRNCRRVASRNHPDLFWVQPEGGVAVKVDQVRELQESLAHKPFEGQAKVAVIEDAHSMTASAANALLKTLEEPPPETYLLLVTPEPSRLPATILSRCQKLLFGALAPEELREILTRKGVPEERVALLSSLAEGSAGKALGYLEGDVEEEIRWLFEDLLPDLARGGDPLGAAEQMVRKIGASKPLAEEGRSGFRRLLPWLEGILRDLYVVSGGIRAPESVFRERTGALQALACGLDRAGLERLLWGFGRFHQALRTNMHLEILAARLCLDLRSLWPERSPRQ